MPPVGGLRGNAALRDASLIRATFSTVRDGQSALVPALHRYEQELRTCGYAAVRAARTPSGKACAATVCQ